METQEELSGKWAVKLDSVGDNRRAVMLVVAEVKEIGWPEAEALIDTAPVVIVDNETQSRAVSVWDALLDAGASAKHYPHA